MHRHVLLRRFAFIFALIIAATTIFFARNSSAAAYIVRGKTTAYCDKAGRSVPADYQDSYFGSELHGFWDSEFIAVSFEFPDGRVFSPFAAELLDGVVDMPPNYTTAFLADVAGDLYFEFPISNKWPYGCYRFSAYGTSSGQSVSDYFVVAPRLGSGPATSPAKLAVWKNGTQDAVAEHDALVNIFGRNFRPNEVISIWITQPNGAVIDYPQQITSDGGNFESTFQFTNAHPTGRYAFTALGTLSGYQVFASFELRARSSTPSGWATLRVSAPFPAAPSQNDAVEVAGTLFSPGEFVGLWMTLPSGAVRSLPTQAADGNGDFYTLLDLDQRLPVGSYSITANGVSSGRLVIATFNVTGEHFDGTNQGTSYDVPHAVETNFGDGTLGGPTNTGGTENSPGPEVTKPDIGSQGCDSPNAFWTPNC